MFKLRRIKKDDIVRVFPSGQIVKVIRVFEGYSEETWLKNYWHERYDITLPPAFKIAVCQFASSSSKNYSYPINKVCIGKPFRQKKNRELWQNDRDHFRAMSKGTFFDKMQESVNQYKREKKNDVRR